MLLCTLKMREQLSGAASPSLLWRQLKIRVEVDGLKARGWCPAAGTPGWLESVEPLSCAVREQTMNKYATPVDFSVLNKHNMCQSASICPSYHFRLRSADLLSSQVRVFGSFPVLLGWTPTLRAPVRTSSVGLSSVHRGCTPFVRKSLTVGVGPMVHVTASSLATRRRCGPSSSV